MQQCDLYYVFMVSCLQNATKTNRLRLAAFEQQKASENVQNLMLKQQVRSVPLMCLVALLF